MTACTNKARGAVVAALAGAMALGAAPAVALATTGDVSLMATQENYVDSATPAYDTATTTFYWNGQAQGRAPETVTVNNDSHDVSLRPVDGLLENGEFYYWVAEIGSGTGYSQVTDPSEGTYVQYYKDGVLTNLVGKSVKATDGSFTMPSAKGTYAIVIGQYVNGTWSVRDVADTFSIVGFSLDEAKLIDGKDVADTTFNFTGETGSLAYSEWVSRLGVAVGNHVLTLNDDYTISIKEKNSGATPANLDLGVTYVATITGVDRYEGTKSFDFTIGKLDLSDAVVIGRTETFAPGANATFSDLVYSVNGVVHTNFGATGMADSQFDVDLKDEGAYTGTQGEYTYTITAKQDSKYVTGSAEVKYVYADVIADVDFTGCGTWDSSMDAYVVNQSSENPTLFDLSHLKVTANGADVRDHATVTVYDAAGNEVDMAGKTQITDFGTYYVKVSLGYKDATTGQYVANTKVAKVVVLYQGVTEATGIFMSYRGDNVERMATDTYDGTDLSQNMTFTVKAGDKTLVQGTDYDVTFEKQAADGTRTAVDEIVDAGTYIVNVDGKTFEGSAEFLFVVSPIKPAEAKVAWDVATADGGGYLAYTGDVLTPSFRFFDAKGNEIEVPADAYVVDRYEAQDGSDWVEAELKEVGTYRAYLETAEGVENYDLDMVADNIVVSDKGVFLDVPANEWYSQAVYDAAKLGYMNGDGGTKTFSPARDLTRAEAVCVLFNMAGGSDFYADTTIPGYDPEGKVFETGFSDVAGNEFFAKAVAWAKATGVVNGYADGTFGVSRKVTSEEFACMLANYAKAMNKYEAVDADEVLAEYSDASSVSDWAKDSVAWAVSEGVMGNSDELAPAGSILRMRVAAMAVNFQPEKLTDIVINVPVIQ